MAASSSKSRQEKQDVTWAPAVKPNIGPDNESSRLLAESLELALQGCLSQLRAFRRAEQAGDDTHCQQRRSERTVEEKALKYSILGIVAQLQSVREAGKARRNDLLLAVLPQALPFLSTVGVFATVQTSTFVRACASAAENQFRLLVPHLDAAPQTPSSLQRFVKEVALSSVRSVSLPAAATWYLLAEHRVELSAVEVLKLPCGCVDFAGIPDLPSLQTLEVMLLEQIPQLSHALQLHCWDFIGL